MPDEREQQDSHESEKAEEQEYTPRYDEEVSDNQESEDDQLESGGDEEVESENQGPHFDGVESFLYVSVAIVSDIGDGLWFTRFFFAPATLLWLWLKGVNQVISKNAIAQAVEIIPGVDWLPISTVAAIMTIIAVNHPEKFEQWFGAAGQALEKIGKKKL